ncbi:unnamed protein product [Rhizoctonia solani]|uniref:Nephrocystin 3-like N-terminal domain-containing protein n=1 Tax=Rhizoctonia solani TaxID=456999 RepID=A0A8H2XN42_9AGAM|nr:unnamed protein product [Rhizoctonia solani]
MSANPPASETEWFRHWITDVEVSPVNNDPNCKFSARIFIDNELVCNLPWIDHTRPLRWSGLLLRNISPSSDVVFRLCRSVRDRPRYFNFSPILISEVDEETGESTLGVLKLPEAVWCITIKSLTHTRAERMYPEELEKFRAIEGVFNSLEPDETAKYLFKDALQFASVVAEVLPECTAKISFLICMKTWELLDHETQLDDTVQSILSGLTRIRDIVKTIGQASSSMLAAAMNRSKEPVCEILALLEDISLYILNQFDTNELARVPRNDIQPNDVYDVEAYLTRLEDLERVFYASWTPAATSGTDPTYSSTTDNGGLELPPQNEQITPDEPTRRADSYEIRTQLRPMDPSGYDPDQVCLDGTREAVLSKIMTWTQNRDNGENFLWISGPAGMGKSSVATSICQRLHNIRALAGSFFCRRDDPDSSDPLRLINNLVHTMAIRLPAYAHEVANSIRSDCSICTSHLGLRYEHLVQRPLERLTSLSLSTTLIVVIDGLDECGDRDTRERLLHRLYNMSQLVPWLKVIISARPVGDVQEYFQNHCSHEPIIHLEGYDASEDIRAYIEGQLGQRARTEGWPDDSIDRLCTMAQGVFLWAALATKYIKKSILPALPRLRKVLNSQKASVTDCLDAMYMRALRVAIDANEDEIKDAHLRCIGAILAISEREPLSIPDLQYLLLVAGQIDQLTLEQTVKNLAPFLITTEGGRVMFHHASFKDFVTDSSRSGEFYIPPDQYEAEPTACCMQVMQQDLRFNICRLETSHLLNSEVPDLKLRIQSYIGPALKYACIHWIDHLVSLPNQAPVGAIAEFLKGPQLMYWIEVLSLLGRLDVGISGLSKLASLEPTPDNWGLIAAWAKDAHRFILSYYDPIAASAPHLYISALAFAPSKSLTALRMRPYFPNTVTVAKIPGSVWHPCIKSIIHPQPVQSLSISPDGLRVVVGYADGSLGIWDLQTGARFSESLVGHRDPVTCVVYSTNSDLIASGSYDTTIRVWDAGGLHTSYVLAGHSGPVHAITFSPDAATIASGSSDKTIRLWDSITMRPIQVPYIGHSSRVSSVAFSSDGTKLVSASWDKTIRVWSVAPGGQQLAENPLVITEHSDSVTCAALSPDGSKIASGSKDGSIQIWDSQTGEQAEPGTSSAEHSDSVTSIAFSPNGSRLVSTSLDGEIHLHGATTLEPFSGPLGHSNSVNGIAFSPNGAYIVTGSTDMTTRVWEISERPKPMTTTPIVGHSSYVYSVAVSSDGSRIISGSQDNTIRMWDAQTGAPIANPFVGHSGGVNSVAISPDGARIVSVSSDRTMKLWDTTTHAVLHSYPHNSRIRCVAFSPNGVTIAFGSDEGEVYLWDSIDWKMIGNALQGHSPNYWIWSVAFSPDGAYLASSSAIGTVIIWDTKTHTRLENPLSGHPSRVGSIAFSPCGTQLVSGSNDRTARLWDIKTGRMIQELRGHSNEVVSVAFSPNGYYIASGSWDNSVRLWDTGTGQLIRQPYVGHSSPVRSVAFSHDGNYVISGSNDTTIRVWGLDISSSAVEQANDPPESYCWPSSPYELVTHPCHPGWVTHDQQSLTFWLPPYYQQPEHFPSIHSGVSRPRTCLDYSKFVHGTAWTAVASDSIHASH